jgi:hypothetical protein
MASETRGRARGGRQRDSTIRIATPRGGFRAWRETIAAEGVTFPILIGLLHFLLVQAVASLAFRFGTLNSSSPPYKDVLGDPPPLDGWEHVLVEPLRLWDGLWYAFIARDGYAPITLSNGLTYALDARAAFWPLFPWLMRLGHDLTGFTVDAVGWIVANAAFFVALPLLYRLVALDFDLPTARRTVVTLAFFPTAFFFSAVYTESLFLLLAVGALLAARQQSWFLAGCVGLLAALTRSQGVLLLAPFAVLFVQQYGWRPLRWFPSALFAILPALGPVLFGLHLDRAQDSAEGRDWLAFITAQADWDRFSATPWETFDCAVNGCIVPAAEWGGTAPYPVQGADWGWIEQFLRDPNWDLLTSQAFRARVGNGDWLELVCFVAAVGLALIGLRLLPLYASAYVWPQLLIPLFGPSIVSPLMSLPRFVLALFPLFVVAVLLLRDRKLAIPALAFSCLLLVLLTAQFAQWYWVS